MGHGRAANIQLGADIEREEFYLISVNEPYLYDQKMAYIPIKYQIIMEEKNAKAGFIIGRKSLKPITLYRATNVVAIQIRKELTVAHYTALHLKKLQDTF